MRSRGFTLIELVMVIIVLGIVGTATSRYVVFGSEIYVDAKARQEAVGSVRFAVERMRRDIHNAVPNSLRVSADNRCMELVPMVDSGSYQQLPRTASEKSLTAVVMSGTQSLSGDILWIYAEDAADIYASSENRSTIIDRVSSLGDDRYQYTFATAPEFTEDSPSRRFYSGRAPISYCVSGHAIFRHSGYGWSQAQPSSPAGGIVIAEGVVNNMVSQPVFRYAGTAASRYAQLLLDLRVQTQSGESLEVYHAFHIANVP